MVPSIVLFPMPLTPRPGVGAGDMTSDAADFAVVLAGIELTPTPAAASAVGGVPGAVPIAAASVEDLGRGFGVLPSKEPWQDDEESNRFPDVALPMISPGFVIPSDPLPHIPQPVAESVAPNSSSIAGSDALPQDTPLSGEGAIPLPADSPLPSASKQIAASGLLHESPNSQLIVAPAPEIKIPVGAWKRTDSPTQGTVLPSVATLEHPKITLPAASGQVHVPEPQQTSQIDAAAPPKSAAEQTQPVVPSDQTLALSDDPARLMASAENIKGYGPTLGLQGPSQPPTRFVPKREQLDLLPTFLPKQIKGATALPDPTGAGRRTQDQAALTVQADVMAQVGASAQPGQSRSDQGQTEIETPPVPFRLAESTTPQTTPLVPSAVTDGARAQSAIVPESVPFPPDQPDLSEATRAILRQIAPAAPNQDGAVEIALFPKGLGRVRLELHHGPGGAQITVSADRPETLDLIRRHSADLIAEFRTAGMVNPQVNFTVDGGQSTPPAPRQDAAAGLLGSGTGGGTPQQSGQQPGGSQHGQSDPRRDAPVVASLPETTEPARHPYRNESATAGGLILRL